MVWIDSLRAKAQACLLPKITLVFGVCLFVLLCLAVPVKASSEASASNEVELIRPESYAIRRFSEVVDEALSINPESPKEQLIRYRALFEISKKKLLELKSIQDAGGSEATDNLVKAFDSKTDYYRKQIQRIESNIRSKRKP